MISIGKVRENHKPTPSIFDITDAVFVRCCPNSTTGTMEPIKYIAQNRRDWDWGLTVCSVGHQRISPGEDYPPRKHNQEYMFDPAQGRILSEYQLLYIIDGEGIFRTRSAGEMKVSAGDMFIIFPGEWHSYMPDTDTGWNEYWIGFQGVNIDHRVENGFSHTLDGVLAGTTTLLDTGWHSFMSYAGTSEMDAARTVTVNPARSLALFDRGELAPRMQADIAVFDRITNRPLMTICRGNLVFSEKNFKVKAAQESADNED